MIEFGLLAAAVFAFLWYRERENQAALVEIDRAGTMINAVLDDLAAMDQAELAKAQDCFAAAINDLAMQFPGDASTLAVLRRYVYNSSDEKLNEAVTLGNVAHGVALRRSPAFVVLTAVGAVALAELNLRKHKLGTRHRRAAELVSISVKDHFVMASSRKVGDIVKEIGLNRLIKYQNEGS